MITHKPNVARFIAGLALSFVLLLNGFCMAAQYCPMKIAPVVTPVHESRHECCGAKKAAAQTTRHPKHCNGDCCKGCKILFHAASALRSEKCVPHIPEQVLPEKIFDFYDLSSAVSPSCSITESPPGLFVPVFAHLRI